MSRNVFLTTIGNTYDRSRHNYYSFHDNGVCYYCEGISAAEAGAKYILSRVTIDEIVVLGPSHFMTDTQMEDEVALRDFCTFRAELPENFSEFRFFCYRIMQYLNRVDIEGKDLLDLIPEKLKADFRKAYPACLTRIQTEKEKMGKTQEKFSSEEVPCAIDHLFDWLNHHPGFFEQLTNTFSGTCDEVGKVLKHYLFMELDSSCKLRTLSENEGITMRFLPTVQEESPAGKSREKTGGRMGNLLKIMDVIMDGNTSDVNLYMDLQGMDLVDSHTLLNILFMLQNEKKQRITIREIISTSERPELFTSPIEDQKLRLELNELLSGMDAFLQYGKVNSILRYWRRCKAEDEHIDKLLYAMRRVDIGISLCSVSEMEQGIRMLRYVFSEYSDAACPSQALESMIFRILENGIRYDYGKLLMGEEIDILALIKWAWQKHFYMQALTIIESRVPYDLVKGGIFYYARTEEEKLRFLREMAELYVQTPAKDRYVFDDLEHYYIKFYRRTGLKRRGRLTIVDSYVEMRLDEIYDPDSPVRSYTRYNGKRSRMHDFLLAYMQIGDIRNQISHAQEFDLLQEKWDLNEENEKIALLEDAISRFILEYEKIRSGIKKADIDSLVVTQQEFKEYLSMNGG